MERKSYQQALTLYKGQGRENSEACVLNNLAVCLSRSGNPREAMPFIQECLDLARRLGLHHLVSTALCTLAEVHIRMGDRDEALDVLAQSQALARRTGNRRIEIEIDMKPEDQ